MRGACPLPPRLGKGCKLQLGEAVNHGVEQFLVEDVAVPLGRGGGDLALRFGLEARGGRRLGARVAADPFWDVGLSAWMDLRTELAKTDQQQEAGDAKAYLSRLRRMTPWAFFVPEILGLGTEWAGLDGLDLPAEDAAISVVTRLMWESGPRGSGASKNAPFKVPAPDLETDFFVALLRAEALGWIGSASNLLRAVAAGSEPWHRHSKRVKAAATRLIARIEEWGFRTLVIPFPDEAVQAEALGMDRERELQVVEDWVGAGRLGARLLILAGGDPGRLRPCRPVQPADRSTG